ncbi:cysteine-rich CWC family protein [uncultured Variovorax sp.]|uniref:cysteine-rich CWC family protein n=1 Tax=uncultured Variovorax sp. TaxID=114708 RepID=UPI0025D1D223|nr:cysteine-rich CWC family protein [uncultured Variovorax sp.]
MATQTAGGLIDAARCPLCGEANRCAMEIERETGQAQPPCWCMQADFSKAPLTNLPQELRGLACICMRCAAGRQPASKDGPPSQDSA